MPVDDQHPEYKASLPLWIKCRDLAKGEDWIKDRARRELYLPPLPGMRHGNEVDPLGYDDYVSRAHLYNATGRTIEGLTGLLQRKDPSWAVPPGLNEFVDDVTGGNISLTEFAGQVGEELVTVGRCGLLIDYPNADSLPDISAARNTVSFAEQWALRPFITLYQAEAITNWKEKRLGGTMVLSMVTVAENVLKDEGDEFCWETISQFRVFDLDPKGYYRQRRFQLVEEGDKKTKEYVVIEEIYPRRDGKLLTAIPFVLLPDIDVGKPVLLDLVNTNISHYRNSADYERGLRFTGNPQPYATKYNPEIEEKPLDGMANIAYSGSQEKEWRIGSGKLWTFVGDVTLGMLTASAQDLSALAGALESKRSQMVTLGARLLGFDKNVGESAAVEVVRRQGDNSALASIAKAASKGLTKALVEVAEWLGVDSADVSVRVNQRFFDIPMAALDIRVLIEAWHEGVIALSDLRQAMREGERLDPERTDEEIDDDLEQEAPAPGSEDDLLAAAADRVNAAQSQAAAPTSTVPEVQKLINRDGGGGPSGVGGN